MSDHSRDREHRPAWHGLDRTGPMPVDPTPVDEAAADELVRLAAARLETDSASPAGYDDRLLDRQAREARRRAEHGDLDGTHRERIARLARQIQAMAEVARLPVVRRSGRPALHEPAVSTSAADAIIQSEEVRRSGTGCLAPRIDLGVAAGVGRDLWDEPVTAWIDLPDGVPAGRYIGLGVNGDSMEPLMHTGDTILVQVGSDVKVGSVIVARHPDDGYVVKRVARLTRTAIHLASLNPEYPPMRIPRDPGLVVGTVVLRWCAHGEGGRRPASG